MDRIHDFVGTMKDDLRQEGIRKREELRPEHVEKYLEIKATTCSQNTINEYASELKKIGRLIGIDLQVEPGDRHPEEIGQPRGGIGYEQGRSG